jgi:hypothetical protein
MEVDVIFVKRDYFFDVIDGSSVLSFEIDDEDSDNPIPSDGLFHNQMQSDSRILTPAERNVNLLKMIEDE